MNSFLSELTESLYDRYGDDIALLNVVLPSRRAGLFMSESLSDIAIRPLWQPKYRSIGQIMESIAGVKTSDSIVLITRLYRVYARYHNESFDSFYFWGEMLLSDFSQIDKYLIDADMLFANISDLKELEDLSYLTQEQIEVISRFWRNFTATEASFSQDKERFWAIWRTLSTIYHQFRDELLDDGLAYEGMVHRIAAHKVMGLTQGDKHLVGAFCDDALGAELANSDSRFVVAGFNALSECEKRIFGWLEKSGRVEFFWDYDNYYVENRDNEAGLFLRENLSQFRSANPLTHDHFTRPKEVVAVAAPSDSMQCKYVHTFLQDLINEGFTPGKETAIVLTDETLLVPVLHSIPKEIQSVNVTMGYPLRQTVAYSFVERLLSLATRKKPTKSGNHIYYHSDVTGLLNHPYIQEVAAREANASIERIISSGRAYIPASLIDAGQIGEHIFKSATSTWLDVCELLHKALAQIGSHDAVGESNAKRREVFTLIIDNILATENSLKQSELEISISVFTSLLRKILQNIRIPYQGEPLEGIQIMGILETRNLDFENVLILSANDDTFPGNSSVNSSFIPYNLRFAYGLPTPQHHDGVYGYYFYRLLQRASKIHIAYSSMSDDKHTGEPSRYIYQLDYESPHSVQRRSISLQVNLSEISKPIEIPKSGGVAQALQRYKTGGGASLSPTAMNNYVECPLKFYYKYIAAIKCEEELTEEIDMPMFGTILHKSMELIYRSICGQPNVAQKIEEIDAVMVEDAIDEAIRSEYLRAEAINKEEYSGEIILVKSTVMKYILGGVLPFDAAQRNLAVIDALEHRVSCQFNGVSLKGIADRIDTLDDGLKRIVDYKTGGRRLEFSSIEALFSEDPKERSSAILQTMLYSLMFWQSNHCDSQPSLYFVRHINSPDYSPLLVEGKTPVNKFSDYRIDFEQHISAVLDSMFDFKEPFVQCSEPKTCSFCDYNEICRR